MLIYFTIWFIIDMSFAHWWLVIGCRLKSHFQSFLFEAQKIYTCLQMELYLISWITSWQEKFGSWIHYKLSLTAIQHWVMFTKSPTTSREVLCRPIILIPPPVSMWHGRIGNSQARNPGWKKTRIGAQSVTPKSVGIGQQLTSSLDHVEYRQMEILILGLPCSNSTIVQVG